MNKYKSIGLTIVFTALILVIVGFAEVKQSNREVSEIEIRIDDQYENYFITESEVMAILNSEQVVKGSNYQEISLKTLESRLEENKFVYEAEIFRGLDGKMHVNVMQNRPIARIVRPDAPDAYINIDGSILPISEKFTARLPVISGEMTDYLVKHGLQEEERPESLMDLLKYVENDRFWAAQIAQIDIDRDWDMIIYPQVTKQYVEFGQPEQLESKFKRLKIFYTRILPQEGWNKYTRVNVKYKDQIICE